MPEFLSPNKIENVIKRQESKPTSDSKLTALRERYTAWLEESTYNSNPSLNRDLSLLTREERRGDFNEYQQYSDKKDLNELETRLNSVQLSIGKVFDKLDPLIYTLTNPSDSKSDIAHYQNELSEKFKNLKYFCDDLTDYLKKIGKYDKMLRTLEKFYSVSMQNLDLDNSHSLGQFKDDLSNFKNDLNFEENQLFN